VAPITGKVIDIWRWPVLGMRGEQLRSTRVDILGVAGDRVHVVTGPAGRLTLQDEPRLGDWIAGFPFNPDGAIGPGSPPYPQVTAPDGGGTYRWGDPRLVHALQRDLDRRVDVVRDLVTTRGVVVATTLPPDPAASGINLQLDMEPPEGGWADTELAFEEGVRLRLVASRRDGPGIEARVVSVGRVALGAIVELG
jgi:hypothetical protein